MNRKSKNDLFTLQVSAEKQNPNLLKILPQPDGSDYHRPTRISLQKSFDSLPGPDGNFIKDFQSKGFSSRVWELYLNQMFQSIGLEVAQPHDRPDFLLTNEVGDCVWVEAVTANPSQVVDKSATAKYTFWQQQDETAVNLGGPLRDKLKKKYWDLPWVIGKPLVLAIADFESDAFGLRNSVHALQRYAYGINARLLSSVGENVRYVQLEIAAHAGHKTIPSRFFSLPDSENISALLFSNAGTVAKFSRMGFRAHPEKGMVIARYGTEYDDGPKAIMPSPFYLFVDEDFEMWNEETVVLHNPWAKHPISTEFFGSTPHMTFYDDRIRFYCAGRYIYSSVTQKLLCPPGSEDRHKQRLTHSFERWLDGLDRTRREMEQQLVDVHRELDLPLN